MKEKRLTVLFLSFIALLFILLSTILTVSTSQRNMFSFLHETEKMLNRLYQVHQEGGNVNAEIASNIEGFGFYDFHGIPQYLYGTAISEIPENTSNTPRYEKSRKTIIIVRDLLNPFIPVLGNKDLAEDFNTALYQKALGASDKEKREMIRYIYLEIKDDPISAMRLRYMIIMGLVSLFIILIFIYIGNLIFRNIKYQDQIESQERLVIMGTAARTFTHEVRNPLSSIRLQSSIIKRSGEGRFDKSLDIINDEVARLSDMTERIGDFLRKPEGTPVDCNIKTEIEKILSRRSDASSFPMELEEGLSVKIDPVRFASILENLLNNAAESGSDPREIRISLFKKGHTAELRVSDKGKGIEPEVLNHIYDPFFTTKSKGQGVGLSIVHSFIHAVNGRMEIRSEPEKGTEVLLVLPLAKET